MKTLQLVAMIIDDLCLTDTIYTVDVINWETSITNVGV